MCSDIPSLPMGWMEVRVQRPVTLIPPFSLWEKEFVDVLTSCWFRVDFQRFQKSREHVVRADQHRQLDDLSLREMFSNVGKNRIGNTDLAGHCVGIAEQSALLVSE
jgi:hypothetical protein